MRRHAPAAAIGLYAAGATLAPGAAATAALAAPLVLVPTCWWILKGANHWIVAFLAAAILLPPLPLAYGNSGPHPALLLAAGGVAAGLVRLEEWRWKPDALSRAMLMLLAILAASVGSAAIYWGAEVAAGSLVRTGLFAISVFVYLYLVHGPGRWAAMDYAAWTRGLLTAAMVSACFACVDFYYQLPAPAGYGAQFVWLNSGVFRRAQGLFYEASTLGNFCVCFLTLIGAVAMAGKRARIVGWWRLAMAGAMLAAAMVFSYSRASIVALGAALVMMFYLRGGFRRQRRWIVVILLSLAVGGAAVYWLFPAFGANYLIRLSRSLEFFATDPNLILSGRLESWQRVIQLLADNPLYLLTGIGYKTLPYLELGGRPVVADNMYLSLLIETGVAGLAALIWLHVRILQTAYRAARHWNPMAQLFGMWMFCFWTGEMVQMLSGDLLTYWRVLPIYFWALACSKRLVETEHERPAA
ncbi:MAG: O-antigen ligase family protein [Bryobacterales bacterium]|nr:O-antigen ligase family protein [Bryobacterales bacterium]